MDINSSRHSSIISETLKLSGLVKIPLDDKLTFEMITNGDTGAVFQLENAGIRPLLRKYKPVRILDLADIIAIFRSGAYRKNNNLLDHPIYQEQIIELICRCSGFNIEHAQKMISSLIKKNNSDIINFRNDFINGCFGKGTDLYKAGEIFSNIASASAVSITKAHAADYAYEAYYSAYLKANRPLEFYTVTLNNNIDFTTKMNDYLLDILLMKKYLNIKVLKIDINKSSTFFKISGNDIRSGLAVVKQVGIKLSRSITIERSKNGDFSDIVNFIIRMTGRGLHLKAMENLIKSGAFDFSNVQRSALLNILPDIMKLSSKIINTDQASLFEVDEQIPEMGHLLSRYPEIKDRISECSGMETEATGLYLLGLPLDIVKEQLKEYTFDKISDKRNDKDMTFAGHLYSLKIIKTRNGSHMARASFADYSSKTDIIIYPAVYQKYKEIIDDNRIYVVKGKYSSDIIEVNQLFLFRELIKS